MAKLVQSTLAELAHSASKASTFEMGFKEEEPALIHVIQTKEELAYDISLNALLLFKAILFAPK